MLALPARGVLRLWLLTGECITVMHIGDNVTECVLCVTRTRYDFSHVVQCNMLCMRCIMCMFALGVVTRCTMRKRMVVNDTRIMDGYRPRTKCSLVGSSQIL